MLRKFFSFVLPVTCTLLISGQAPMAAGPVMEGTFETVICLAGPTPSITDRNVATAVSWDVVGTPMAKEGELLYGTSARYVGSTVILGRDLSADGACLYTDGDGDRFHLM